jgi:Omp85 superfamily domain
MKNFLLLLFLTCASVSAALAQGAPQLPAGGTIENVQVTGIPESSLSEDLRNSLQTFVGQQYDPQAATRFAARIEGEVPDVLVAPRLLAGSDSTHVRLVFVVARSVPGGTEPDSNVNSQYTVESVEVKGLQRSRYSDAVYEDMQHMVGQKLDNKLAEDLRVRLSSELRGEYYVNQKIERGSQPEHVKVIFEVERTPWIVRATVGKIFNGNIGKGKIEIGNPSREGDTVEAVEVGGVPRSQVSDALYGELQLMVGKRVDRLEVDHLRDKLKAELKASLKDDYLVLPKFTPGTKSRQTRLVYEVSRIPWLPYRTPRTVLAYHPKQGWTFVCCGDDFLSKYTTITAGWDGNSLIERYKGFSFGVESRSLGNRRLGGRLQFDSWGVQWKPQTRLALESRPEIPGTYRSRIGVAPSIAFALNRNFFVTAGANFTELRMEGPTEQWDAAHEGVASLRYDSKEIKRGKTTFENITNYEVRTGARSIGSDFSYTRHFVDHSSTIGYGRHSLDVTFAAGKITGNAPLFERFSLGNVQTLRGWNKYDIDPIGGTRVWHTSVGYRYSELGVFMDVGDIWEPAAPHEVRTSLGVTLFNSLGMAFPLKCSEQCGPTFYFHFR